MNLRIAQIWHLTLPSIISNITVPLLGLVDVTIVGHIGDSRYISAIAVGTMIFNVIYWVFGFLRMGTSGMTSQAYGSRQLHEVTSLLLRTLSVGFGIGLVFVVLQALIIPTGLYFMKPEAEVLALCKDYCYIVIWGAPAMLGLYGLTGWFVGMQNTRIPMIVSIVQNVVNIIASLFLVFVMHLGIAGVALGTLIAQWSGLLLSLYLLRCYYRRLWKYINGLRGVFRKDKIIKFFVVNRDIFLRTLFLVSVMFFFTSMGSRQGTTILAVNTLLMQFFTIFSYFSDGFAYAGEALCGKYYGAGNKRAFKEVVNSLFFIGLLVALSFTLFYLVAGDVFLSILTSDANVVSVCGEYMLWPLLIPIVGISTFLFDGIFVGITNTKGLLWSSVIASAFFFSIYFILEPIKANHALWLAFVIYLFIRGVVEFVIYRRSVA